MNRSSRNDIKRIISEDSLALDRYRHQITSILNTLKLIYDEISNLRESYQSSYEQFLSELALRIQSESLFYNIYENKPSLIGLSKEQIIVLELLDTPLKDFILKTKT